MPTIISSHRSLLGGMLGVALLSYLQSVGQLAGIYNATARFIFTPPPLADHGDVSQRPAVVAWFDPQHPHAPICRIYDACFDDDGSRLVLPLHFLSNGRLRRVLHACGVGEGDTTAIKHEGPLSDSSDADTGEEGIQGQDGLIRRVLYSDNVLRGDRADVDFVGPRQWPEYADADPLGFLSALLPSMYTLDRLAALGGLNLSVDGKGEGGGEGGKGRPGLSLATCITATGEECALLPTVTTAKGQRKLAPGAQGKEGLGGRAGVGSMAKGGKGKMEWGEKGEGGKGRDKTQALRTPVSPNVRVEEDDPSPSELWPELAPPPPNAWHRNVLHMATKAWKGHARSVEGPGPMHSCVRSVLASRLTIGDLRNGSFADTSHVYRLSNVSRVRAPSCDVKVTLLSNAHTTLQHTAELRRAIMSKSELVSPLVASHLRVSIQRLHLNGANMEKQVSVMQSSDVVVLGRGSRYGGNVAFLPQDRAIIEILPLGLDPTPAADVAQALDLRYHFVVTPPRPLADVSRCNGRNGSFVQAYGLLASEWERRDGLGTSRAQWDHDSLQCIMGTPLLFDVDQVASRVVAEASRLCGNSLGQGPSERDTHGPNRKWRGKGERGMRADSMFPTGQEGQGRLRHRRTGEGREGRRASEP